MRLLLAACALLSLSAAPVPRADAARPPRAATPAPAPASVALALPAGTSLATVTGSRLFPRLAGEPMPGWLQAYGGTEMGSAYEGYHEEATLPGGVRQVMLRTQGLLGVYVLQGERCVGHLLFEPLRPAGLEDPAATLRRAGFVARAGVLTTADRGYGAHVTLQERRRAGLVEQYMLLDLPHREDTVLHMRRVVGVEACYPARLEAALGPVIGQGKAALAEFCRAEEQRARQGAP